MVAVIFNLTLVNARSKSHVGLADFSTFGLQTRMDVVVAALLHRSNWRPPDYFPRQPIQAPAKPRHPDMSALSDPSRARTLR